MADIDVVRTGARDDAPANGQAGPERQGGYGRASLAAQLAAQPDGVLARTDAVMAQEWAADRLAPFPPLVRVLAWAGINALAWGAVALGAWWLLA